MRGKQGVRIGFLEGGRIRASAGVIAPTATNRVSFDT